MKSPAIDRQVMVQDPTNSAPGKNKFVSNVRRFASAALVLLLFCRAASAQNSPYMSYHGGGIMPTAKIQAIFWGPSWQNYINNEFFLGTPGYDKIAGIGSFYEGFSNSGYAQSGDEYTGSNGRVGPTTSYAGYVFDLSTPANGSHPSLILNEVCKMIKPDPSGNGYYPVYTDIPFPGGSYAAAWHSFGLCPADPLPIPVQFAFFFDTGGDTTQGGSLGHSPGLNALADWSAHELSEARTDPDAHSGWYDTVAQSGENGDKCEGIGHLAMFPNGTQWSLQGEWSNIAYTFGTGYPNMAGQNGCLSGNMYVGAPGDYDGDGKADIAVWRPSEGNLYVLLSSRNYDRSNPLIISSWGIPGDIPVPGDYDGDGKTDFAVWRPSDGNLYVLLSSRNYNRFNPLIISSWSMPGDIPVPGDYDGDGKTDFALWRPSTGAWYVLLSSSNYAGSGAIDHQLGAPGDIPVPGKYFGPGPAHWAVWMPGTGNWTIYFMNGPIQWGEFGDYPL